MSPNGLEKRFGAHIHCEIVKRRLIFHRAGRERAWSLEGVLNGLLWSPGSEEGGLPEITQAL